MNESHPANEQDSAEECFLNYLRVMCDHAISRHSDPEKVKDFRKRLEIQLQVLSDLFRNPPDE